MYDPGGGGVGTRMTELPGGLSVTSAGSWGDGSCALDLGPPPHIQGQRQEPTWVLKEQQKPSKPVEGGVARVSQRRSLRRCSGQRWRYGEKGAERRDTCSQELHLDDVKFRRWRKSSTCEVIRQDQIIQGNGFVEKRGRQ